MAERSCTRNGKCIACAWHLRREQWCLPKAVVVTKPDRIIPCRYFQPKEIKSR